MLLSESVPLRDELRGKVAESLGSRGRGTPSGSTPVPAAYFQCRISPTGRGDSFKHYKVSVRIRNAVPNALVAQQQVEATDLKSVKCRFESVRGHQTMEDCLRGL